MDLMDRNQAAQVLGGVGVKLSGSERCLSEEAAKKELAMGGVEPFRSIRRRSQAMLRGDKIRLEGPNGITKNIGILTEDPEREKRGVTCKIRIDERVEVWIFVNAPYILKRELDLWVLRQHDQSPPLRIRLH